MEEDADWALNKYGGRQLLVCRNTLISMEEDSYAY